MKPSKQVITFRAGNYNLAVDVAYIRKLTSAKKIQSISETPYVSIAQYDTDESSLIAGELFPEPNTESSQCSLIELEQKDKDVALKVLDLGNIITLQNHYEVPIFKDNELSNIFGSAFIHQKEIYYLLNVYQLIQQLPDKDETIVTKIEQSEENFKNFCKQPAATKNLSYLLSIAEELKANGYIHLTAKSVKARIGFTLGYPTFSTYNKKEGLEALKAIQSQDWNTIEWLDQTIEDSSNLNEDLKTIFKVISEKTYQ